MMNRFYFAVLAVLGITFVASAFTPAPVYKEPPKLKIAPLVAAMQGTWELDNSVMLGGRVRGGLAVRRTTYIRIQNNSWSYVYNINGTERQGTTYEMVLDPRQNPATLDLKLPNNGQGAAQVALKGIVKVEGNQLTFCYVSGYNQNVERPRHFEVNAQFAAINAGPVHSATMTLKKVK